ncbi:YncE family protein [Pseudomonas sp. ADAK13]|uniref:YncE family protein n=1 Tax=Pseudomonas sp. ADAK13 TaxID=2730847 RepID=UPI0014635A15|nr:YncE family protein [Pseudomonas sp. ADAK13]QJI35808.1 YncE family protein [Pseudomonas sp. ADAK13]
MSNTDLRFIDPQDPKGHFHQVVRYNATPGKPLKDIKLKIHHPHAKDATINITLPKGFHYADGTFGQHGFKADSEGRFTLKGTQCDTAAAVGSHSLVAEYQGSKVWAQIVVQQQVIPIDGDYYAGTFSPDGKHFYAVAFQGDVSVIDTEKKEVIKEIEGFERPLGIAASQDGKHVYVCNGNISTVAVINTHSNTIEKTLSLSHPYPFLIAINPAGNIAYVTSDTGINVVDIEHNKVLKNLDTPGFVRAITFNANGYAYAVADSADLYEDGSVVLVINTSRHEIEKSIPLEGYSTSMAVSIDGKKVYAAIGAKNPWVGDFTSWVAVITTVTNTVEKRIEHGHLSMEEIAISPNAERLYLYDLLGSFILDLRINSGDIHYIGANDIGRGTLEISPDGGWLYTQSERDRDVLTIKLPN